MADDLLRDVYVKGKYRDIILSMTIIRRVDAVLEPTKDKVLKVYNTYKDKFENLDFILGGKQGNNLGFSNYSKSSLQTLLNDPKNIRINFENYLDCFSENIKDIISKFKFKNQLDTLEESNILFGVIERFCSPRVNFGIEDILDEKGNVIYKGLSNLGMGYVLKNSFVNLTKKTTKKPENISPQERS